MKIFPKKRGKYPPLPTLLAIWRNFQFQSFSVNISKLAKECVARIFCICFLLVPTNIQNKILRLHYSLILAQIIGDYHHLQI